MAGPPVLHHKPLKPARPVTANAASHRVWLAGAGLVLATALAYSNSLQAPFVFDDGPAIANHSSRRGAGGAAGALRPEQDGGVTTSGRPLVSLSFAFNRVVSGDRVWSYHIVNVGIHLLAGLTLWGVLGRTLGKAPLRARFGEASRGIALGVAALWLLHPLQTAAVTYTVQRAESLMGLLYLLTLHAFARGAESARPGPWLGLSLAACLAGMATKEVMVSAPLMVWLYDRTFVAGSFAGALRQRRWYYAGLAATWLPLVWLVLGTGGRGGTAGFATAVTPCDYLLTQCEAIVRYLGLVVWPHPLVFDYGTEIVGGLGEVWWQGLVLLGLLAGTVAALKRRPVLGFAGAWFFVILAPSSSIVPVASQTMAEHRMYLPLAAPLVLIAAGLRAWLGRRALAGCLVLAAIGGVLTAARNSDYATEHGLWADTVAKRPANARAHHNLGLAELARGNLEKAAGHLRDSIALAPAAPESRYNLGLVLARLHRPAEAIASYEKALELEPGSAAIRHNLANALAASGRREEAGRHHAEAVRLQPRSAAARNGYAHWLLEAGRPAEALAQCEEALRLDPGLGEAHFNAGNACAALGRPDGALAHYREAVRLQPGEAPGHNNLANALLEQDRVDEAIRHYREAVRLDADYVAPRRNLALLLLHLGRVGEARPHLETLARLRPGDADVAEALRRARSGG